MIISFPNPVQQHPTDAANTTEPRTEPDDERKEDPLRTFQSITLTPSAVARTLGAIAVLLLLASVAGQLAKYWFGYGHFHGLVPLFDVNEEQNIPTLYSVLLLFIASLLLAIVTVFEKRRKAPYASRWVTLLFGFIFMTVDEASSIHEKFSQPVGRLVGDGPLGLFHYAWVIPGIVVVLVLALFFLRFLLHLPPRTRFTFMIAGTVYVCGAIGLELIGGGYAKFHGDDNLAYNMIATVEEALEMAGVILFIHGLLKHINDNYHEVRLRFNELER